MLAACHSGPNISQQHPWRASTGPSSPVTRYRNNTASLLGQHRHMDAVPMAAEPAGSAGPARYDHWFVTGASRGIGLEMVKQLLETAPSASVIAAVRSPSQASALQQLAGKHPGRAHVIQLDAADPQSVQAAAQWVDDNLSGRLDYLINNAGIMERELQPWHKATAEESLSILNTNVVGPLLVTSTLLPALRKGTKKTIANISSSLGSLASASAGVKQQVMSQVEANMPTPAGSQDSAASRPRGPAGFAASYIMYKASKAALNMEMLVMANDLVAEGFTVVSLHPGWVQTDMGNSSSEQLAASTGVDFKPNLTPEQSVGGLLGVLRMVGPQDTGRFIAWDGKEVPW